MQPEVERILVVDDERAVRLVLSAYLSARGYVVDVASERKEAEVLLAQQRYALVITDLLLHGSDSSDMLEFLRRAKQGHPATELVLLTGSGEPEVEEEARSVGVRAVIYKPITMAELARIVGEVLGHST
jgi:two-component system, OmpR family, phosphate regulon response regulator OmpR